MSVTSSLWCVRVGSKWQGAGERRWIGFIWAFTSFCYIVNSGIAVIDHQLQILLIKPLVGACSSYLPFFILILFLSFKESLCLSFSFFFSCLGDDFERFLSYYFLVVGEIKTEGLVSSWYQVMYWLCQFPQRSHLLLIAHRQFTYTRNPKIK